MTLRPLQPDAPRTLLLSAMLLVILFHLGAMLLGLAPDFGGNHWHLNWDTDSYSRILRVLRLHESGDWYDPVAPYYNAPYGLEMHWTRPLDMLLYAGAWVGSLFTDFQTALEVWATLLLGPLLHLLYVPLLFIAARPFLAPRYFLLLVVMLLSMSQLWAVHRPGFIDFHGLLVLLLLGQTALLLRLSHRPSPGMACGIGVLAGLSLWLSVEGLVLTLPVLLVMALYWVQRGGRWLDTITLYGTGLAVTLVLALAVERPPGDWLSIEYDRVSILHLFIALGLIISALLLQQLEQRAPLRSWAQRLLAATPVALLAVGLLIVFFPALAGHPQQEVGPIVDALLESQPGEGSYLRRRLGMPLPGIWELGPLLITLPYSIWGVRQATGTRQQRFILYLCLQLFFLGYLLLKGRALPFMQLALLLPWIEFAQMATKRLARRLKDHRRVTRALAQGGLLAALFWHQIIHGLSVDIPGPVAERGCDYDRLAPYLERDTTQGTVLAPLFAGPELVYRTGLPVISAPYHRNRPGIEDGFVLLWMDPDDPQIRQIARARALGYVVFCRDQLDSDRARILQRPESLVYRLYQQRPPAWLEAVKLPEELERELLVYRLRPATR